MAIFLLKSPVGPKDSPASHSAPPRFPASQPLEDRGPEIVAGKQEPRRAPGNRLRRGCEQFAGGEEPGWENGSGVSSASAHLHPHPHAAAASELAV